MSHVFQLLLLLTFSQIGCRDMDSVEQSKQVYLQKLDEDHSNYIELVNKNGTYSGVFYGVEISPSSNKPIYYKSLLYDLKVEESQISFKLEKLLFSNQSFYGRSDDSSLVKNKPENIPLDFTFPISYLGNKSADSLKLQRVLFSYDSKSDQALFIKKS